MIFVNNPNHNPNPFLSNWSSVVRVGGPNKAHHTTMALALIDREAVVAMLQEHNVNVRDCHSQMWMSEWASLDWMSCNWLVTNYHRLWFCPPPNNEQLWVDMRRGNISEVLSCRLIRFFLDTGCVCEPNQCVCRPTCLSLCVCLSKAARWTSRARL